MSLEYESNKEILGKESENEDIPNLVDNPVSIFHPVPEWNESKEVQIKTRILREESHRIINKKTKANSERIALEEFSNDTNPLTIFANSESIGSYDNIIVSLSKSLFSKSKNLQESELPEKDIDFVMCYVNCTREGVIKALINNDGDIIDAIMELTM